MSIITKISTGKGREKRVNIFLDGEFALSLPTELALEEGLRSGQELTADRVAALSQADRFHRGYNAALRFLSPRPRSEAEIITCLRRRGFNASCTERVIARLKEQQLVDDTAFARFWKENRESFSPRSRQLTRLELQRKGLAADVIEAVVNEVDNGASAYRAGVIKARRLTTVDYPEFRRRLGDYLRRKGFDFDIINQTVANIWKEREPSSIQDDESRPVSRESP